MVDAMELQASTSRTTASQELALAVEQLREIQSRVPDAIQAAVEGISAVVAIQNELSGEAFDRAYRAARTVATIDAEHAIAAARVESKRTGWPFDERSIRAGFGIAHIEACIREAGAPRQWEGVANSAEALAIADAAETIMGRRSPRVVAFS